MDFIVYSVILFAAAQFHRYEHARFVTDMKTLARDKSAQSGMDFHMDSHGLLQRAFAVRSAFDGCRYAVPVITAATLWILLAAWVTGTVYLAVNAARWFLLKIRITPTRYEIQVFNKTVFSEAID